LNFPVLAPGSNSISISASGAATFAQLAIEAKSSWL
jgi:phage-related protein